MCCEHSCDRCLAKKREWNRERRQRINATDAPRKERGSKFDRPYLVEDLAWLLGTDTPANVAARLGYARPESLTRRLYRMGRADLARLFQRTEPYRLLPAIDRTAITDD